jgi:hypothetical protein
VTEAQHISNFLNKFLNFQRWHYRFPVHPQGIIGAVYMKNPINNSLLLAVLTTSATFCTLTTILGPAQVQSAIESTSVSTNRRSQVLDSERRSSVIRNVGFCIVASVGMGVVAAEASRKWQAARKANQLKQQQMPLLQELQERVTELQTEVPLEALQMDESIWSQEVPTEKTLVAAGASTKQMGQFEQFEEAEWDLPTNSSYIALNTIEFPPANSFSPSSATQQATVVEPTTDVLQEAWQLKALRYQILESPEQYETCRIRVPQGKQQWFAVTVENHYYRLFQSETIKEKALKVAGHLSQRGDDTIVTHIEDQYMVWVLEPEAVLV